MYSTLVSIFYDFLLVVSSVFSLLRGTNLLPYHSTKTSFVSFSDHHIVKSAANEEKQAVNMIKDTLAPVVFSVLFSTCFLRSRLIVSIVIAHFIGYNRTYSSVTGKYSVDLLVHLLWFYRINKVHLCRITSWTCDVRPSSHSWAPIVHVRARTLNYVTNFIQKLTSLKVNIPPHLSEHCTVPSGRFSEPASTSDPWTGKYLWYSCTLLGRSRLLMISGFKWNVTV